MRQYLHNERIAQPTICSTSSDMQCFLFYGVNVFWSDNPSFFFGQRLKVNYCYFHCLALEISSKWELFLIIVVRQAGTKSVGNRALFHSPHMPDGLRGCFLTSPTQSSPGHSFPSPYRP